MTFGRILTFTALIRKKKMEIMHMTFNDIGAEFIKSFEDLKIRLLIACILKVRVSLQEVSYMRSGRD